MVQLFSNIRFYVVCFSIGLSICLFFLIKIIEPATALQITKLTQYYALIAIIFLYFALLASPFTKIFNFYWFNQRYLKARRAIGVSAFYFGLLHASLAFFGQLGGLEGVGSLTGKYLWAVILSSSGLVVLLVMTLTSFDRAVKKLSFRRWKLLHRLVYLASLFLIIHALILGTHFSDLSNIPSKIGFVALAVLLSLEAFRLDGYLKNKFTLLPRFGLGQFLVVALTTSYLIFYFF